MMMRCRAAMRRKERRVRGRGHLTRLSVSSPATTASSASSTASRYHDKCALGVRLVVLV